MEGIFSFRTSVMADRTYGFSRGKLDFFDPIFSDPIKDRCALPTVRCHTRMQSRAVTEHDQVVGNVKTEASKRPIPIDPFIAEDLLCWYRATKYNRPEDYVFATNAPRAGKRRGKQPVWLSKVMQYHIQPAARRVGITKRIGWHTFRHSYTTLLHNNGEDVKVVQELLRHGSSRVTLDVYAQAVTPAKRKAQKRVVSMLRDESKKAG
jgi:integrase